MKVKNVMIPIAQYATVDRGATLRGVFEALEEDFRCKEGQCHPHRDVVVLDEKGKFAGIINLVDILRSLEPNYGKLSDSDMTGAVLSRDYVLNVFKQFGLWSDSLEGLCEKAVDIKVADIIHVPDESEVMNEEDDLALAIHHYIYGVHQPIMVRNDNGEISGVLRLSDIFEEVRSRMLACEL